VVSLQFTERFLVTISRAYFDYWPIVLYLLKLIIGEELQIYVIYESELGREVGFVVGDRC
jgi:hypothetical protein